MIVNLGIFEDHNEPESTRKITASTLREFRAKNRVENIDLDFVPEKLHIGIS